MKNENMIMIKEKISKDEFNKAMDDLSEQPIILVEYVKQFQIGKCIEDDELCFLVTKRENGKLNSYCRPFAESHGRKSILRTKDVILFDEYSFDYFLDDIKDSFKKFASVIYFFDQKGQQQLPRA